MKHKLLSLVIAGLTVSAVAHADNIPTVYGKVNVTLNNYNFDRPLTTGTPTPTAPYNTYTAQDNWQLESNSSRLGVKGDYPVAGDTKIIYKLEYELFADGSASSTSATKYNTFTQRNTYAGLQSATWGTLFAGKNDTPLKAIAAETVQLFKDLPLADFKYFLVGEDRENNIIQYTTPSFSGFNISAQVEPGEDSGQDNASKSHTNHGIADKYSLAATYKWQTLYLALANTHNVQNTNIVRAVGQYGIGPVSIGALWQKADRNFSTTSTGAVNTIGSLSGLPVNNTNSSNGNPITDITSAYKSQDGYVLSVAWKVIDDVTLKGQYGHSSSKPDSSALSDTKAKNYVLGADYKLNDNSKVFAYYAVIDTDGDSARVDGNLKDKTFAVGYDFKF